MRKLMLLLAFLAVWGQALAGVCSPLDLSDGPGHLIAHAQHDDHHHHDDGGMHLDDSSEGSFHVHIDGSPTAALLSGHASKMLPAQPQGPPAATPRALPFPALDGLLRPPQAAS